LLVKTLDSTFLRNVSSIIFNIFMKSLTNIFGKKSTFFFFAFLQHLGSSPFSGGAPAGQLGECAGARQRLPARSRGDRSSLRS
jgi:hypothetical protein